MCVDNEKIFVEEMVALLEEQNDFDCIRYQDYASDKKASFDVLILDFDEIEKMEEMELAYEDVLNSLEQEKVVVLLHVPNKLFVERITGVGVEASILFLLKHRMNQYIYLLDSMKYINYITSSNGKKKYTSSVERGERYWKRMKESVIQIMFDLEALHSYERGEELEMKPVTYLIIKENYSVDGKQQVENEIVYKIGKEKGEVNGEQRLSISSVESIFSPVAEKENIMDEERQRGYFQNYIQMGIQSERMPENIVSYDDGGYVVGFEHRVVRTKEKLAWEYQMKKTMDGMGELFEYQLFTGNEMIAPLTGKCKKQLEMKHEVIWDVTREKGSKIPFTLFWETQFCCCCVPVAKSYWYKKAAVENQIYISILIE